MFCILAFFLSFLKEILTAFDAFLLGRQEIAAVPSIAETIAEVIPSIKPLGATRGGNRLMLGAAIVTNDAGAPFTWGGCRLP